jgi:hypothetical protein
MQNYYALHVHLTSLADIIISMGVEIGAVCTETFFLLCMSFLVSKLWSVDDIGCGITQKESLEACEGCVLCCAMALQCVQLCAICQ